MGFNNNDFENFFNNMANINEEDIKKELMILRSTAEDLLSDMCTKMDEDEKTIMGVFYEMAYAIGLADGLLSDSERIVSHIISTSVTMKSLDNLMAAHSSKNNEE